MKRRSSPMRRRRPISSQGRGTGAAARTGTRARRRPRNAGRRRSLAGSVRTRAESSLRRFRQSSLLAVSFTGLLLLLLAPGEAELVGGQSPPSGDESAAGQPAGDIGVVEPTAGSANPDDPPAAGPVVLPPSAAADPAYDSLDTSAEQRQAAEEATGALREMWDAFGRNLPKYGIAIGIFVLAAVAVRVLRTILRLALSRYERAEAITALAGVVIWLLAVGIAVSVVVGDVRALAGSLGLVGLGLSWALQTPIESFTGWLLNSFKGYYRVGDRIAVGDIFGDVYRIDFLNTTVWEVGGQDHPPGWIQAEQPTGRLITFPNNEVLAGSVINYTRDFPYVWDELTISVANESDLRYAMEVLQRVTDEVMGDAMDAPTREYRRLLERENLEAGIADGPRIYASTTDWGTNLTMRYLVGAREKRKWKSEMVVRVTTELNRPEHRGRILPVYPRQQVQMVRADGSPAEVRWVQAVERDDDGAGT